MPDRRNRSVERDWKSHSAPSRQRIGLSSSRNAGTPLPSFQGRSREAISIGKFALALAGDYYQFYVGSEIMKEEKRVGAVIQFALINPEADGLPAYDSTIGTVVSGYEDEIVREFPKDTEFSYDSDLEDLFQITTEGGILKVTLLPSWSDIRGNYAIYARHNEVYTKIYVKVE